MGRSGDFHIVLLKDAVADSQFYCIIHEKWISEDGVVCLVPKKDSGKAARLEKEPQPSWIEYQFEIKGTFRKYNYPAAVTYTITPSLIVTVLLMIFRDVGGCKKNASYC